MNGRMDGRLGVYLNEIPQQDGGDREALLKKSPDAHFPCLLKQVTEALRVIHDILVQAKLFKDLQNICTTCTHSCWKWPINNKQNYIMTISCFSLCIVQNCSPTDLLHKHTLETCVHECMRLNIKCVFECFMLRFKEYFIQKRKCCHYLLTLMLSQTHLTLVSKTKDEFLKTKIILISVFNITNLIFNII